MSNDSTKPLPAFSQLDVEKALDPKAPISKDELAFFRTVEWKPGEFVVVDLRTIEPVRGTQTHNSREDADATLATIGAGAVDVVAAEAIGK